MSEQKIVLTLNPEAQQETETVSEQNVDVSTVKLDDIDISMLTPEDLAMVDEFSEQIDITDGNSIMSYGASSQNKIAEFSGNALNGVKTKDLGEIGDMISDLVVELKGFDLNEDETQVSILV